MVAAQCWERRVALVVLRTSGYLGSIRLQLRDHEVIESKPDTKLYDLRLANPWPELAEHAASNDLATVSERTHAHACARTHTCVCVHEGTIVASVYMRILCVRAYACLHVYMCDFMRFMVR